MVDPLSGGPAGFPQLFPRQASLHSAQLPAVPTGDPGWILVEEGFTLAREHEVELLFAIGNGYAGSRGSLAEGSALSAPATFVAGVFDSKSAAAAVPSPCRRGRDCEFSRWALVRTCDWGLKTSVATPALYLPP